MVALCPDLDEVLDVSASNRTEQDTLVVMANSERIVE